jgi:hypothetical protein
MRSLSSDLAGQNKRTIGGLDERRKTKKMREAAQWENKLRRK